MRDGRRKRLIAKRRRLRYAPNAARVLPRPAFISPDDPIQARVDLVRFAAFAEAAAESMEAGLPEDARARFDEAAVYFGRALEAAKRAGLSQEIARLKLRVVALRKAFEALHRHQRSEIRNQKSESKNPRGGHPSDF
jgi:hypothetical protein